MFIIIDVCSKINMIIFKLIIKSLNTILQPQEKKCIINSIKGFF